MAVQPTYMCVLVVGMSSMHEYKASRSLKTYARYHPYKYAAKSFLGDSRSKLRQEHPSCLSKKIRDTAGDQHDDTRRAANRHTP